ncbi:MAG: ABC transporter substrate-binding protein [Candidatus Omnitrophica bacterium]|nr:ABC transporter substrate-binding protein [Candidatus Omnitrophota bacterium]
MNSELRTPNQSSALGVITVGHTPDMDDAFMFYGIAAGALNLRGLRFEHVIEDIQALNQRAQRAELDMTAISAASYPALSGDYWIVSVGSSVGRDYGPLVISKQPRSPQELAGQRIAVPGLQTTAYMLLRLAVPDFEPVVMPFSDIPQAVLRDEVAAGLVIHEWQLIYRDAGLLPVLDLGTWWQAQSHLPLPLGLNVVKKSLKKALAQDVATVFRDSILYSFAHQEQAVEYAMQYGRGIDANRARQFIGMYVNEDSLTLSKPCRQALRLLFDRAHAAGLIPRAPRLSVIEPLKT